ncbi:ABC transporter substrate-binding protein [Micrococcaceae bacterium Sec5.1]
MIRHILRGSTARVLAASITLVLGVTLSACGPDNAHSAGDKSAGGGALPKIRVATAGKVPAYAEVVWGIESGIFKKHGVDVEMTPPAFGPDVANLIINGNAEIGVSNATLVASARDAGRPLVAIATSATPYRIQLVFTNETDQKLRGQGLSESSKMSDLLHALSGMTLGTYSAGSSVTGTFRYLLSESGINPEKDNIKLQPMPDNAAQIAAVANKRVDGVVTALGGSAAAIASQKSGVLWDLSKMSGNETLLKVSNASLLTSESVVGKSPEALQSFLDGYRETQKSLRAGLSAEDAARLKKLLGPDMDQGIYDQTMADVVHGFSDDYVTSEAQWDALVKISEILKGGPISVPYDKAIDNRFAMKVK